MIKTVDDYINSFPDNIKEKLICLRMIIVENAPDAKEGISWGVPTYNLNGFLVQFAVYKKHLGFYTSPATLACFQEQLNGYKTNSKNTVRLPIDQDLPVNLIKE
ncbi:DUF1801 domain-containing protein, partial [Thomasclavelia cocleata]